MKEFLREEWETAKSRPVWSALSFLLGAGIAVALITVIRM